MPNFPAIGHETDVAFLEIVEPIAPPVEFVLQPEPVFPQSRYATVEPTAVTHSPPYVGENPYHETFYLWSGDIESTLDALDARLDALEAAPPAAPADASTTVKGITRFATPVEAEAGTSELIAVTPAALQAVLDTFLAEIFGPGISRVEAITRTAYDLLSPPVATTLYVIDEES
jgi:hypothetical protein